MTLVWFLIFTNANGGVAKIEQPSLNLCRRNEAYINNKFFNYRDYHAFCVQGVK